MRIEYSQEEKEIAKKQLIIIGYAFKKIENQEVDDEIVNLVCERNRFQQTLTTIVSLCNIEKLVS